MIGLIILITSLIVAFIIVYDINNFPETKDENHKIDDPTTACWHDDDEHYPDSQI